MSTSQKHADFVRETMKEKPIEAIAGIGEKAKEILVSKGFEKAYHLLVRVSHFFSCFSAKFPRFQEFVVLFPLIFETECLISSLCRASFW